MVVQSPQVEATPVQVRPIPGSPLNRVEGRSPAGVVLRRRPFAFHSFLQLPDQPGGLCRWEQESGCEESQRVRTGRCLCQTAPVNLCFILKFLSFSTLHFWLRKLVSAQTVRGQGRDFEPSHQAPRPLLRLHLVHCSLWQH